MLQEALPMHLTCSKTHLAWRRPGRQRSTASKQLLQLLRASSWLQL
jgi:hypothetical protein